jgi:hypothetical protein
MDKAKNTHGGEKVEEKEKSDMGDVTAETVNITQGGARNVQGTHFIPCHLQAGRGQRRSASASLTK